jgi:hypothetical protein
MSEYTWRPSLVSEIPLTHITDDGQRTLCGKDCSDWRKDPYVGPYARRCRTCWKRDSISYREKVR